MPNYFRNNFRIFQNDSVQITAQRGFDRVNEFWINIELRNERTGNRVPEFFRTVDALEEGLRTFGEAFTLFVKLTQHFEARSLFGEGAMERGKLLFGLSEEFLLFANAGLDIDRLSAIRFQRDSELPDEFIARFGQRFDLSTELFDLCVSQFAARFGSGEFLFERRDSAFGFRHRKLQFLQARHAIAPLLVDFSGQSG